MPTAPPTMVSQLVAHLVITPTAVIYAAVPHAAVHPPPYTPIHSVPHAHTHPAPFLQHIMVIVTSRIRKTYDIDNKVYQHAFFLKKSADITDKIS